MSVLIINNNNNGYAKDSYTSPSLPCNCLFVLGNSKLLRYSFALLLFNREYQVLRRITRREGSDRVQKAMPRHGHALPSVKVHGKCAVTQFHWLVLRQGTSESIYIEGTCRFSEKKGSAYYFEWALFPRQGRALEAVQPSVRDPASENGLEDDQEPAVRQDALQL